MLELVECHVQDLVDLELVSSFVTQVAELGLPIVGLGLEGGDTAWLAVLVQLGSSMHDLVFQILVVDDVSNLCSVELLVLLEHWLSDLKDLAPGCQRVLDGACTGLAQGRGCVGLVVLQELEDPQLDRLLVLKEVVCEQVAVSWRT